MLKNVANGLPAGTESNSGLIPNRSVFRLTTTLRTLRFGTSPRIRRTCAWVSMSMCLLLRQGRGHSCHVQPYILTGQFFRAMFSLSCGIVLDVMNTMLAPWLDESLGRKVLNSVFGASTAAQKSVLGPTLVRLHSVCDEVVDNSQGWTLN